MKRLVITVVCAAVLGMPAESEAAVPAPSPCLAGYHCATVAVDVTKAHPGYSPGNGRMTSEPAGIDCTARRGVQSGVCTHTFSWRASSGSNTLGVTLTAKATADSSTHPLSSPSSLGDTYKHMLTIASYLVPEQVNFIGFNLARWPLKVTKTGAGSGRVLSPSGIDCGSFCEAGVDHETKITLTAAPAAGAVFKGWSGACNGQEAICTLTVTKATLTNAVFDLKPPPATTTPTPNPTPRADRSVDASVLAARAGKTRLGARVVEVELAADEDLAVALTLARKGKKLALKRFTRVKEGRRILTLVLPKTLRKGLATLQIAADDTAGNRKGWRRTVRVPSLDARQRTLARMMSAGLVVGPAPSPCRAGTHCAEFTVNATTASPGSSPGSGRMTTQPAGIDCTAKRGVQTGACSYTFSWPVSGGTNLLLVTLTAKAAADSWAYGGPFSLANTEIRQFLIVSGSPSTSYYIRFNLAKWPVKVTKTGAGTGRVSSPSGIDCGSDCDAMVDHESKVALTAKPDAGAVFKTWTGACNGQDATCTLTVTQALSTNAVFDVKPPPPPPPPTTPADKSVDASVLAARATKTRLGARVVEVELAADEDLAVALTLARKGKKLALKRFAQVKEGRRVLTLVLPKTLKKGIATLQIAADDSAGNRKGWRRTVRIPARTKVVRSIAAALAPAPPIDPCNSASCATLAVAVGGNGSGRVTSEPSGIDCIITASVSSGTCERRFLWPTNGGALHVTLRLQPATGSVGVSPSGNQYESSTVGYYLNPGATILFDSTRFVLRTLEVSVTKSGAGTGRVVGTPGTIDCGSTCKTTVNYGTKVTLTTKPDAGAVFKTWTGACNGQDATCRLTVTKALSTNAVFDVKPPAPPPPPPPPPTTTTPADTSIDAALLAARAGKTRLGVRIVEVELTADEDLAVALTLARKGKKLALKRFARVKEGRRVLTLVLPKTLRKGIATLQIAARDAAGNRKGWRRTVRVPSGSTRHTRSLAAAPTPCRIRITAAGHTWAVSTTNGFPCAAAGPIVRKLAAKTAPSPVGRYPGRYAGLVCVGRLPGKTPSLIICGTRSRGFTAVRGAKSVR